MIQGAHLLSVAYDEFTRRQIQMSNDYVQALNAFDRNRVEALDPAF